jgi:hypothetical protein
MGDSKGSYVDAWAPAVSLEDTRNSTSRTLSSEELLNEYGIKLISWEFSAPIKNTYK